MPCAREHLVPFKRSARTGKLSFFKSSLIKYKLKSFNDVPYSFKLMSIVNSYK